MIRAALVGLLMPPSDDPKRDREIFLKTMTTDDDGLWQRKNTNIPYKEIFDRLTEAERARYVDLNQVESGKAIHHCIDANDQGYDPAPRFQPPLLRREARRLRPPGAH